MVTTCEDRPRYRTYERALAVALNWRIKASIPGLPASRAREDVVTCAGCAGWHVVPVQPPAPKPATPTNPAHIRAMRRVALSRLVSP